MKFCEECGAQLEDDVRFCEECGAEQEILITEQIIVPEPSIEEQKAVSEPSTEEQKRVPEKIQEVPIEENKIAVNNIAVTKERKKGKGKMVIAVIAVLIVAGVVGYLLGRQNSSNANYEQESGLSPTANSTITLTPDSAATELLQTTPTLTLSPTELPIATPTPVQTATPTPVQTEPPQISPSPTLSPVVVPTATPIPIHSVYEGFVLGNCERSAWKLETQDGIYLSIEDSPMAQVGYITNGTQRYDFQFEEFLSESSDAARSYTFYGEEGYHEPEYGNYDELRLSFEGESVAIYWAYHHGQNVEVYYDNIVSMEFATYKNDYVSYGEQSMEISDTRDEMQNTENSFQTMEDGTVESVLLYADVEDEISMSLSYNAVIQISVLELYGYEESVNMTGVITKRVRYGVDECYYIVPRFAEGPDFWGEPLQDLSEYETYYEIKIKFSEEGAQLCWMLYENDVKTLLYDGMIDVEYIERRVSIKKY